MESKDVAVKVVSKVPLDPSNKLRTPPLWGVRTRYQLMRDGQSLTFNNAILRHAREASMVINSYRRLNGAQRNQVIAFLRSL